MGGYDGSPPAPEPEDFPPPPADAALAALLDDYAPFSPAPLAPEVRVFCARDLTAVWSAADRLAGRPVPSPFWAYPWPGGAALARSLLDHPEWIRGRTVLDVGSGGGVAALAAARAGAARALANDVDPWAAAVAALAAARQGLSLEPITADLTGREDADVVRGAEVVLCGDMGYERSVAPRIRRLLTRAAARGALVLVADPGRAYFDAQGLERLATFAVTVPVDLEGVARRDPTVYRLKG